jgi:CBS domain-containing protein
VSSLVVVDDAPVGIVTKRDALRALTVTDRQRPTVRFANVDLLDDASRDEVRDMVEGVTDKYGDLTVLESVVHLHEHDETLRGTPLLLARVRVYTDRGNFIGRGEGYGARHAISLALNDVERQLLEGKTHGRSKKHPDAEYWEKYYGWWLAGPPR